MIRRKNELKALVCAFVAGHEKEYSKVVALLDDCLFPKHSYVVSAPEIENHYYEDDDSTEGIEVDSMGNVLMKDK